MIKGIYKSIQLLLFVFICIPCLLIGLKIDNGNYVKPVEEEVPKHNLEVNISYSKHMPEMVGVESDPIKLENIIQDVQLGYKNRWGITEISQEEKDLLAKVLYLEAHNTGLEGTQKVAVVIFNRYLDGRFFGNNASCITSILSAPGQFTTYKRAINDTSVIATDQEYNAIETVLNENVPEEILNMPCLYFNGDGIRNYFW